MNNLPWVVLVGRQNVGKSELFNKIATTQRSLVHDYAGVTRDTIEDYAEWKGVSFRIIDTAGITFSLKGDVILESALEKTFFLL